MATARTLYFSGETQVACIEAMPNKNFRALFGDAKSIAYDSFSRLVGYEMQNGMAKSTTPLPIDRKVNFKKHPSLHACGSRCLNAKGHDCECSCHGKNHGLGVTVHM